MLKRKTKRTVTKPLNLTNPFYTTGVKNQLKTIVSKLPTGVYSVEARDRALDARRNSQRLRTGALSAKQLRVRVMKNALAKRKFLTQLRKIVQNQGLSEELAQRILNEKDIARQWSNRAPEVAQAEEEITNEVRRIMPGATQDQIRAAIQLYHDSLDPETGKSAQIRKLARLIGRGINPDELRVKRLFEMMKPAARREELPPSTLIEENDEKDRFRMNHQEALRKYLTALHGAPPSKTILEDAFPKTAEPLIAVSTPKPNPTLSHKMHTRTPFSVTRY